jgi:hypothetical protein
LNVKKLLVCLFGAWLGFILLALLLFQQKNPRSERLARKHRLPAEKSPDFEDPNTEFGGAIQDKPR